MYVHIHISIILSKIFVESWFLEPRQRIYGNLIIIYYKPFLNHNRPN